MQALPAAEFIPIAAIMGHHSLPDVGRHAVISPSKGALIFDVSADADEMKVEVSSPYYVGSCSFRARSAGSMLEVLQGDTGWRAVRSIADFIEHPEGVRLAFFDMNIRRPGAPDYDWRN